MEMYSSEFQFNLAQAVNPYGEGGATERILSVIREVDLEGISKKVLGLTKIGSKVSKKYLFFIQRC